MLAAAGDAASSDRCSRTNCSNVFGLAPPIFSIVSVTANRAASVFRLAISEAAHAPKVAQALESIARKPTRDALREIMANAKSAKLFAGDPDAMAEKFAGLLWGDLMTDLMLHVADRPSAGEIARRARDAASGLLMIYPQPG